MNWAVTLGNNGVASADLWEPQVLCRPGAPSAGCSQAPQLPASQDKVGPRAPLPCSPAHTSLPLFTGGSTASHTQALPVFCNPRSHRRRKPSQAERGLFSVICLKFYVRFTVAKRRCRQTVPSEELGSASGSAVAVPVDSSEVRGPDPRWPLRGEDS